MIKFDKKYLYLMAVYFVMQISIACYSPYLNIFYKSNGMSTDIIGIVAAISPLAAIFIQPYWAKLADSTGKKHTVISFLYIAVAIAMALYYFTGSIWGYIAVNTIYAAFFTGIPALQDSYVLSIIEKDGHSYSTIRMSGTLGYAFGALLLSKIFQSHLNWIFGFTSFFFILSMVIFNVGVPKIETPPIKREKSKQKENILKNKYVLVILLLLLSVYMSVSFIGSFVGVMITDMGYPTSYMAICVFISAFSEVPVLLFSNKIINKFGEMNILIFTGFLITLRMFLYSTEILWIVVLMQALQGLTYMLNFYCGTTLMFRIMPPHLKSKGQSMIFLVQAGIASVIGNIAGGKLVDILGFSSTFRIVGLATLILTIVAVFIYRKYKLKDFTGVVTFD